MKICRGMPRVIPTTTNAQYNVAKPGSAPQRLTGQMRRVFLLQGAIVGALGSALGVLLAVGLIKAFTTFVRGSDGLPLFAITLAPGLALGIAGIATLCGVVAAVAPARRAAALDPAQAIRL